MGSRDDSKLAQKGIPIMATALNPTSIAPPFGDYSHGIKSAPASCLVVTSGQLGLAPDGSCSTDVRKQAEQCFANIDAILHEAGCDRADVIRLSAFVTDRAFFPDYMAVRDEWLAGVAILPASTLLVVSGFTREEFKVEIEATAIQRN
jgi:2-iminobutanoate/2-iminopropanoate deaminase